jgi:hypothetical protein
MIKAGEDECWLWTGADNPDGYGVIWITRKTTMTASRFAWELFNKKKAPAGKDVHHTCYTRNCVNPKHLELRTHAENVQDQPRYQTISCQKGLHLMTPSNTYLRPSRSTGRGACKACNNEYKINKRFKNI